MILLTENHTSPASYRANTPAGNSRYTYNGDGTLASKTDGSDTWTYGWDPNGDQRLLSMSLNGILQVAFQYDMLGRMLLRTPYTSGVAGAPTSFEWDGWTCVRETRPEGVFRYYAPQGELLTFDFTPNGSPTESYCVHADALGSVRAISDDTGAVVAHFEYDAWGNLLPSSSDLAAGFAYRFVGALGCRWDETLGMTYMRQRWYDPGLQRFVSRDPIGLEGGSNSYAYVGNVPTLLIDTLGLSPESDYETLYQYSIELQKQVDCGKLDGLTAVQCKVDPFV